MRPLRTIWAYILCAILSSRAAWCMRRGRNDEAVRLLTRIVESGVDFFEVFRMRGQALEHLGKTNLALADYDHAIQLEPSDPVSLCDRGALLEKERRFEEALTDLTEAINLNPRMTRVYYFRGRVWTWLGDMKKSIADHSKALELEPRFSGALFERGACLARLGQWDDALSDLNKSLEISPDFPDAYASRAKVWFEKGDLDKALADADQAIERNTVWLASAYHTRASVNVLRGNLTFAIRDYDLAIQADANVPEHYVGRAICLYEMGNLNGAMLDCIKAFELTPSQAATLHNLGLTFIDLAAFEKGISCLEKAIELDPENASQLFNTAWILATCTDAEVRDGVRALSLATRIQEMTEMPVWRKLELMAVAHAECGNDSLGLDFLRRASAQVPAEQKPFVDKIARTLESGMPYHETPRSKNLLR